MKDYIHLRNLVFNQAHLCTPDYAETVLSVIGEKFGVDESAYSSSQGEKRDADENISGGTYILPVLGSMVHRGSTLDAMSGVQSYQSIQGKIQEAIENPNVKQILLDIDSPGGSVAGAFDLKDYILEAKEKKPIYAIARDSMTSAAYLIGSACTKVYATQTANVGSIGVVAMHLDQSEANKKQGIKPTFIYAGDMKVAGNPHESLEGDALDYLKQSVQESYEMFTSAVASNRNMDEQAIRDTEARVYKGSKAVELGLVDEVKSYDALIEELANNSQQRVSFPSMSIKGDKMDKEEIEKLEADYAQVSADYEAMKADNEKLRKALIDNGFTITAEGVEPKAEGDEPVKEMVSYGDKTVDLSAMPEEAAAVFREMIAKEQDAKVEAQAAEMFPNMNLGAAKAFVQANLPEDAIAQLKAADKLLSDQMEEVGNSDVDGEFDDPQDKLDKMIAAYAEEHSVTKAKATTAVTSKGEGRELYKQVMKKD